MKRISLRRILWMVIFAFLCAPFIQYNLNIIKSLELTGYYKPADDTIFTKKGWWEGGYQDQKSKYINDHMGFREDLVRVNNTVDFSIFNLVHSNGILGKEQYLFYSEYINAHLGRDFHGYEQIGDISFKMSYLQKIFEREGKTFVMAFAPNKADCYSEYLPGNPRDTVTGPTNRQTYKHYFDSLGVSYIDFSDMFIELKKTKKEIMSKQGIHWTVYGATFAVDSIARYISRDRNITMPEFKYIFTNTDKPKSADNDIGSTLNLIRPIKETFTYPAITIREDTMNKKPSAVYIGDSFMWLLLEDSIARLHSHYEYWYYFMDAHRDGAYQYGIDGWDWKGWMDSADCVIILYTPSNLWHLPKFVNATYEYYKGKEARAKQHTPVKKE